MTTIYLHKEPGRGVCYYADSEAKRLLAQNPWADAPTRRNRYVMWNCSRYPCVWLEPERVDQ